MRVILIGAGISSSLISLILRRQYGPSLKLIVFDKARAIGGRMTTTFDNEKNARCSVDVGAQYLTWTKGNSLTSKYFQQLQDDRVIELLERKETIGMRDNPEKIDYTAPRGISSVVEYFFDRAAVEMNLSKHITHINLNAEKTKFQVSINDKILDEAEAVIVTVPVPQLLTSLKGSISQLIDDHQQEKENLQTIKYSARFVVGLMYPPSVTTLNLPWKLYYVDKTQSDCLRFLAVDNAKRNRNEPPFSLVAHTSVEFGAQYIDDDKKVIGQQIQEKIFEFLPDLPRNVSSVKYHKWKYSQVLQAYPGKPGYLSLHDQPLLLLSGDGFAKESNFEGCIEAAIDTVKKFNDFHPAT